MKLIILPIILIILVLFLSKSINMLSFEELQTWLVPESANTDNIAKQLFNDKWNKYRLGDLFFIRPIFKSMTNDNLDYHEHQFPESIASEYIKQNKPYKHENMDLLLKIISLKNKNFHVPELVLHIRIGDVICAEGSTRSTCYSRIGDTEWWDKLITYIKNNNIKKVNIVSGSHKNECLIDSARYLENRRQFLNKNGINVEYTLGQSPDDDLIFASKAKHFISTGGGYGKLIGNVVEKNGGTYYFKNDSCFL